VVITTGGLGPTCDDRTREALAEALGQKLVFDPEIEEAIKARFALFSRTMTPNNLKQAYKFERGEVLPNPNGTAPGLWVEQDGKVLCMLPGPPNELQPMFMDAVLPRLARLGLLLSKEAYVQIRTAGIGESALEHKLQAVFKEHPEGLSVAYCAHFGQVDVRLSSPSLKLANSSLQQIAAECAFILGEDFMCFGHDSLAKLCADMLRRSSGTLAVAESATGGMLADSFTHLCGASKYFAGGIVCTSNDAKTQLLDIPEDIMLQHGAASAEVAVAMALGAAEKLGADYALATTGFAGPCDGPRENPVGSIFVALQSPLGVWSKEISYPGPRLSVKQRAVNAAIDWLRRELLRNVGSGCLPPLRGGGE
jgi:nicotinamide-nucleotide amidase